jgi:hypothetical protein
MGLSLETKTPGGGDQAFRWLLHTSGTTLATGFQVSLGDGTDTPLYLGTGVIGVKNAGGYLVTLNNTATSNTSRDVAKLKEETVITLATATTNSTVTATAITGASFQPEANSSYAVRLVLFAKSAAITTGVRLTIAGSGSSLTLVEAGTSQLINSLPGNYTPTAAPVANQYFGIVLEGVLTTGASVATPITLSLYSEVATSQVEIGPGSLLMFKKL